MPVIFGIRFKHGHIGKVRIYCVCSIIAMAALLFEPGYDIFLAFSYIFRTEVKFKLVC